MPLLCNERMITILTLLINSGFSLYFFYLGVRMPIVIVWVLRWFLYVCEKTFHENRTLTDRKTIIWSNMLLIIRGIILLGIITLLNYFSVPWLTILLIWRWLSIALWLGSIAFSYHDWVRMFSLSYIFFPLLIIIIHINILSFVDIVTIIWLVLALSLGICSFIAFIIWSYVVLEESLQTTWSILLIYGSIPLIMIMSYRFWTLPLFIFQCIFWVILVAITRPSNTQLPPPPRQPTALDIVAGKKVIPTHISPHWYQKIRSMLVNFKDKITPSWRKRILYANIIATSWSMIMYFLFTTQTYRYQLIYRVAIALFCINFLQANVIQANIGHLYRFSWFSLITAAVYVFLFVMYDEVHIMMTCILGIAWNIGNAITIFFAPASWWWTKLKIYDYAYWIVANCLWFLGTLFLMWRIDTDTQLLIALSCLYSGLFFFITYYNREHISTLKTSSTDRPFF